MDNETQNNTNIENTNPTAQTAVNEPVANSAPEQSGAVSHSEPIAVPSASTPPETLPAPQPQLSSVIQMQGKSSKPWFKRPLILIIVLVLLVAAGATYWVLTKKSPTKSASTSTTSTTKSDLTSQVPAGFAKLLPAPTKVDPFTIFTDLSTPFGMDCTGATQAQISNGTCPAVKLSSITFYQIGSTSTKQPIYVLSSSANEGPGGPTTYVVVKDSNNHYTLYGRYSYIDTDPSVNTDKLNLSNARLTAVNFNKALTSNASLNTTDLIPGLSFPSTPTIGKLKLNLPDSTDSMTGSFTNGLTNGDSSLKLSDYHKLASQSGVDFYEVTLSKKGAFDLREIDGALGGVFKVPYQVTDPLLSTPAPSITWSDGSKNTYTYSSRTPGCGAYYGYLVATNIDSTTLTLAGTSSDGQKLYQLADNDSFLQDVYINDYGKGAYLDNKALENLSIADFQKDHVVLIAKNALGDYQAYLRKDLFAGGGCAKPVIYLYPTKTSQVNVKVGANITKSDPNYDPAYGWQNVTAQPSGQLSYRGQNYNSLFWEGFGFGVYPDITSGTVVKQSDAVSTIKSQLSAQGFKPNEISDFLAYWQPKLPKTPYILLSWLTTGQMNTVAPLKISPAPQTVIRTFLDYKGLNAPIKIPAQHFTAPVRNGFTVVEWGGLAQAN